MEKYFLHINEPCSESWDEMTPSDKGRFCASCQKTVLDFTTASDNEIIQHLEKMKGKMFCAQFEDGQLNRWMEKTDLQKTNPSFYKYLLSFLLLTAGQQTIAQKPETKQETVIPTNRVDSALIESALRAENPETICGVKVVEDTTGKRIIHRGGVSSFSTNTNPLYVLDGIIITNFDIYKLDTKNIESIDVLKGTQAMAIYGSEGVNGVIIITSKKQSKGKVNKSTSVKTSK
jgi:TonB-dependent SusC/RagA subfamily outer membrane receptor